jgi:uncharacterized protein YkwD
VRRTGTIVLIAAAALELASRRGAAADRAPDPERDLLALVNARRARGTDCGRLGWRPPAPPLAPSPALAAAAAAHARDMAAHGYLAHRDRTGRRAGDRARLYGYRGDVGENIAWRAPDPPAALAAWLASPDHCANLMKPRFRETGVGLASSAGYGLIWVATFGRP